MGSNIILYGPPGTGKTYNTIAYAISIIYGRPIREVMGDDYGELTTLSKLSTVRSSSLPSISPSATKNSLKVSSLFLFR